jgi:hypothetical protein
MTQTRALTAALAGVMFAAGSAHAQQDSTVRIDERWRAYLGCWETRSADFAGPLVCIAPTSNAGTVDVVTVAGDTVVHRTRISVTGDRVRVKRDGCDGWEIGRFSADERRIYTTAEFTCDGGVTQQTQSLFSMVRRDAFTRVDGITTRSGAAAVRLITFNAVTVDSTEVPADLARRMPPMQAMPTVAARIEASALLSVADVADASRALNAAVVEAWLADRGEGLDLDAKQLRSLRDAKVPGSTTDLLIALANPRIFQIGRAGDATARPAARTATNASDCAFNPELCVARGMRPGTAFPYGFGSIFDPFFGMGYGYGAYGWNAFNPLFFNGYYGSCFSSFNCGGWGAGGWGGWGNGGPIVVVPQPPGDPAREERGRAVNGSGYTRGSGSSDGSRGATPSPSVSNGGGYSGGGATSGGGGGSSSGGSGSGGSSSSGGSGRTAKPRP